MIKKNTTESGKKRGFRTILFWFFVVEHLVLGLFVLVAFASFVSVYALSPFGDLDRFANGYKEPPKDLVITNMKNQLVEETNRVFETGKKVKVGDRFKFTLTTNDLNSFTSQIKLPYVSRTVVRIGESSTVWLWAKPRDLIAPVMVETKISLVDGVISLDLSNWTLGPIALPIGILDSLEKSIGSSISKTVNFEKYGVKMVSLVTKTDAMEIVFEVVDSEKLESSLKY